MSNTTTIATDVDEYTVARAAYADEYALWDCATDADMAARECAAWRAAFAAAIKAGYDGPVATSEADAAAEAFAAAHNR